MSIVQNHQVNILVVDPDAGSRAQIHELLIGDGYGCRALSCSKAAIQAAKEKTPSLLICDIDLGDGSGLDLFAQLKSECDCPVVFLSSSRSEETLQLARRAGGTYFLSKPIDPTVLLELVDKSLWMPHLVKRHVESAAHEIKPPTIAATSASPLRSETMPHWVD